MAAANGSLGQAELGILQAEFAAVLESIDGVAGSTRFNGLKVLGGGAPTPPQILASETSTSEANAERNTPILDNLQRSFLQQSEQLAQSFLGLNGGGANFEVVLEDSIGGAAAFVTGSASDVELHIDTSEFDSVGDEWPNNTLDNLIAHEMTHAVMLAQTNLGSFEMWFTEGTAEFVPGGDLRVDLLDGSLDGQTIDTAEIVGNIDNIRQGFGGSQLDYATAYVAVRYLHDAAGGGGIRDTLAFLSADPTRTLDDYFAAAQPGGAADLNAFVANFKADGASFMATRIDLADTTADMGGIGGQDADGGSRDTSLQGAVPDVDNATATPLSSFAISLPDPADLEFATSIALPTTQSVKVTVGEGVRDAIDLSFKSASSESLALGGIDLSVNATAALGRLDTARDAVLSVRSEVGALQNRLETSTSVLDTETFNVSAAASRIRDVDIAAEAAMASKASILQQAMVSTLAQAQEIPRMLMSLL